MSIYNTIKEYTALTEKEINWLIETSKNAPSGNIVIAGTYKGGDAMAIRLANPNKRIIVIDSFEGLADPEPEDIVEEKVNATTMVAKEFSADGLENYLSNFNKLKISQPHCFKMFITEETIRQIKIDNISMMWLDLDHYLPTKVCLEYFHDKLNKDAIIGCHDYGFVRCPGVKRACDSYSNQWVHGAGGIFTMKHNE